MNESYIIRALDGDKDAFTELYNRYAEQALRLGMSVTRNESLAAEAVQEAFLRIFRKGKSFKSDHKFQSWFFKIVVNESKRILLKNKYEPEPEESISVPGFARNSEDNIDFHRAFEQLPEDQRIILTLKFICDYSEKSISEFIKKPPGTVKSRLYYAKKHLAEILEGEENFHE